MTHLTLVQKKAIAVASFKNNCDKLSTGATLAPPEDKYEGRHKKPAGGRGFEG